LGIGGTAPLQTDINTLDAKILNPPTGNLNNDIGTVASRITATPSGVLSTDVQSVKTALGVGGVTPLLTDVAILDAKVLNPPTGNLENDIDTVALRITATPSG